MPTEQDELRKQLAALLAKKPELVPPPDGLWESVHATWTGLWTDFYGVWDELQASDVFPLSDFLSDEREKQFVDDLVALILADRAAHKNQLLDRVGQELIGADDVLTMQEADGKCEDAGINLSAYIKEGKNGLRARQRKAITKLRETEI
jgi:hypothetical protein